MSVHKQSGKFQARITEEGKRRSLGYFDTAEAAHAAWMEAGGQANPRKTEPLRADPPKDGPFAEWWPRLPLHSRVIMARANLRTAQMGVEHFEALLAADPDAQDRMERMFAGIKARAAAKLHDASDLV